MMRCVTGTDPRPDVDPALAGGLDALVRAVETADAVLAERDAFVLTTNVDHRFRAAGWDEQRLFSTQGDYGLLQCSVPCAQVTFDARRYVEAMVAGQEGTDDGLRVPAETLPTCPRCGAPLTTNLRVDDRFVQERTGTPPRSATATGPTRTGTTESSTSGSASA